MFIMKLAALLNLSLLLSSFVAAKPLDDALFAKPPAEARPWVYWFWLNGNISSNGITADLEAMKRVGIGGVLIMEVDQGAPVGPADFMSPQWRDLFKHVAAEARRLGLEVNMNNDAGWNGSGGPWIKPEQAMQKVVWSETNVSGPVHFEAPLAQPETVAGFYRDIAVLAVPAPGSYRIDRIRSKAMFEVGGVGPAADTKLPAEMVIPKQAIVNLTAQSANGKVTWDVPAGNWTLLRFGHTCTAVENSPAPKTGRGLECDKLSKAGIEANFAGMMAQLARDNGLKPAKSIRDETRELFERTGLVATHIDSWENGAQNWTATMRDEFQRRRGYDLLPMLPVMTGRVVESLEYSERFLWDLRKTVSQLVIENYAGRMRELAHANGMRFTVEAYGGPCDNIAYGGQSDEPMGEFWSPNGAIETCKGMASSGHVYGKNIIGAEAFTAADQEKWREHPGGIKALGDRAFCEGINRFVFHRYALQPWKEERRPGMTMGPWGQHYERTQTWWEQTPAWHEYLARCQHLLRHGLFVADICYIQSETPPTGFNDHPRRGYEWDECGTDVVVNRMAAGAGGVVLPDGMSYRVLVLPHTTEMSPALLRKIRDLVSSGATVVASARPQRAPGLNGYPACDQEVKDLATELWGDCDGQKVTEHKLGAGRLIVSSEPERVLLNQGIQPDFQSGQPLRFIHRAAAGSDIYFVANPTQSEAATTATFRVGDRLPEFWFPETGATERVACFRQQNGITTTALRLEAGGSVFVVFRYPTSAEDPVVRITRDDKTVLSAIAEPPVRVNVESAVYGPMNDSARMRNVRDRVQSKVDAGERDFPVQLMADRGDPAPGVLKTLLVNYRIGNKRYSVRADDPATIHINPDALNLIVNKARYGVLDDPKRTRDVRDKLQRLVDSGESAFQVARMAEGDDPAFLVVKTLEIDYLLDGQNHTAKGTDPEVIDLKPATVRKVERIAELTRGGTGNAMLRAFEPGAFLLRTASGKERSIIVRDLARPLTIKGPWTVHFAPGLGAPPQASFDSLISWSDHPEPGIKFFSGSAAYSQTFNLPRRALGKGKRLFLDLGKVEVMAEVTLNGRKLPLLWKNPYRLEITDAARGGQNRLEVKVTNRWPNRLIGDEQLPEDSERNPDGTLKKWPDWLLEGKPSPAGRFTFTSWRLWKKTDAPLPSGLLGPVRLEFAEAVPVLPP
jgi:hypothetical protein